jgi:hypothetical protein
MKDGKSQRFSPRRLLLGISRGVFRVAVAGGRGYPIAWLVLEEKRMSRNPEVSKLQSDTKYAAIQWLMLLGVFLGVVAAIRFFWIQAS